MVDPLAACRMRLHATFLVKFSADIPPILSRVHKQIALHSVHLCIRPTLLQLLLLLQHGVMSRMTSRQSLWFCISLVVACISAWCPVFTCCLLSAICHVYITLGWLGGVVVRASDLWSTGREFNSQPCTARLVLGWVTVCGRVNHLSM